MMGKSARELIESPQQYRPHVVLLGAGASRAAFPMGERSGLRIPLMNDLVDVVGFRSEVEQLGDDFRSETNFELIYSRLVTSDFHRKILEKIEKQIENYFSSMQLPDETTIYDHLLLSLQPGDAIISFNWDPFLFDAFSRNRGTVGLPGIYFLHGNVRIGKCPEHDHRWGAIQFYCQECGLPFKRIPLLYPVGKKGYSDDAYIRGVWQKARQVFAEALVLTIFGYSAPSSDEDAVKLLESAWKKRSDRKLEHVEIVDKANSSMLYEKWKSFTPTFHLHIREGFFETFMANWPRRSKEAVRFPMLEGIPCEAFPLRRANKLADIQKQVAEIGQYEL